MRSLSAGSILRRNLGTREDGMTCGEWRNCFKNEVNQRNIIPMKNKSYETTIYKIQMFWSPSVPPTFHSSSHWRNFASNQSINFFTNWMIVWANVSGKYDQTKSTNQSINIAAISFNISNQSKVLNNYRY